MAQTKTTIRLKYFTVLFLLLVLLSLQGDAQRTGIRNNATPSVRTAKPKLVLVIVVDQFRYDYLERFGDLFGPTGFKKLLKSGALFTNANYDYVPTYTACGHAAIFSGSIPAQNGIVGNTWFDRESGRVRVMVADDAAQLVTSEGVSAKGAASPRTLIGTTIGDQMRLSNNFQSRVFTASYKDRSAVLPGGQRPNGAYWFSEATGSFVTSDYYAKELPRWVKDFNSHIRPNKYFGLKWEPALAPEAYKRAQSENLPLQKSTLGSRLPFVLTGGEENPGPRFYAAFEMTPFASEYLADFCKAAVSEESLGADEFPDLLSISFSSPDLIGHYYGPDSIEIEDSYIRLDTVISNLLGYINSRIGLENTIVVLTGDHGVAPVPEYAKSKGFDSARMSGRELTDAVNKALSARFGDGKWVLSLVNDQIYLDRKLMAEKKADPAEVERVAGEAALTISGVVTCYTRSQLVDGRVPVGPISRRVINGFNRQRSGDVWVITKPFYFFSEGELPTTHGSPYNYDTHVPIVLFGANINPGRYNDACSPSDIAPTLAALLGIEPPSNRTGRVLSEAIASPIQGTAK